MSMGSPALESIEQRFPSKMVGDGLIVTDLAVDEIGSLKLGNKSPALESLLKRGIDEVEQGFPSKMVSDERIKMHLDVDELGSSESENKLPAAESICPLISENKSPVPKSIYKSPAVKPSGMVFSGIGEAFSSTSKKKYLPRVSGEQFRDMSRVQYLDLDERALLKSKNKLPAPESICPLISENKSPVPESIYNWWTRGAPKPPVSSDVFEVFSCIRKMKYLPRRSGEQFRVDEDMPRVHHLVFVCLYMPPDFLWDPEQFDIPFDLNDTCSDLYFYRHDFEVVLVSKMDGNFDNNELLHKKSLHGFPDSSIVVPFSECQHRNYICDLLELRSPGIKWLYVRLHCGRPFSQAVEPHLVKDILENILRQIPSHALRSHGRFWESMWPVMSAESIPRSSLYLCPIYRLLSREKPNYSKEISNMVSNLESYPIEIHKSFDVKFLFSLAGTHELDCLSRIDGEKVLVDKAFRDKYIMVCSFHVPILRESLEARYAQFLSTACSELYDARDDFEMVVVAKMNRLADDKDVFERFLLGFCSSCFVIPFEDNDRRDFICRHLDLDSKFFQCLVLDKGTNMKRDVLYYGFPNFVLDYGADAFPFDDQMLNKLQKEAGLRWTCPSANNLAGLLGCERSFVLEKINVECGSDDVVTISDLSKKVVGLFLCVEGSSIPMLKNVYEQCLTQQQAFEIVLVYSPCIDCLDPRDFQSYVDKLLQKHELSVWRLPFKNSTSLKLWNRCGSPTEDQVIIVGANDSIIDPHGIEVMKICGIDAYPFTREGLVQRELGRLEELTFMSLLLHDEPQDDHCVYFKGQRFPVSRLNGVKILLWIGLLTEDDVDFYHRLSDWYQHKANSEFEVVFVRSYASPAPDDYSELSEIMPWYVLPLNPDYSAFVLQELFGTGPPTDALVEFGTTGKLCSLEADYLLDDHDHGSGDIIPCASSTLRRDVIENFRRFSDFMYDFAS